jgi:multidrug efflux pump subunit AcrA (membrane-fusion protein)
MTSENSTKLRHKLFITGFALSLSLALGSASYFVLAARHTPPPEEPQMEVKLSVYAEAVASEDVQVVIHGFGETKAATTSPISSKVAGEVVWVHPQLKSGQRIVMGETLVRIDASDYKLAAAQAEAQVRHAEAALQRIQAQWDADRGRIDTVRRNFDLASVEYKRDESLLSNERIGSEALLNASEANLNTAKDAYDQVKKALALYPAMQEEGRAVLDTARLKAEHAAQEVLRTEIKAPFAGRIKLVQVQLGQSVSPGVPLVVLADDSYLEISISLDADVARTRLQFETDDNAPSQAWFADLRQVECNVLWAEGDSQQEWTGFLDRIERFDQITRTLAVAVRVPAEQAAMGGAPLVEGMFCKVWIPGAVLQDVFKLPRHTVTSANTVYIAKEDGHGEFRLGCAQVEVVHRQDDFVLIKSGLSPGMRVVTTKLSAPLPHTPLDLLNHTSDWDAAGAAPEYDSQ